MIEQNLMNFYPGMGQAVAERTILRKKKSGEWENWQDVSHRVALGNSLLCKNEQEKIEEYNSLHKHLLSASTLMSGRHLQHGDENQAETNMEVFTNCSSSSTSFMLFYLLMNGSGVGRSYDDDMMLVDWDNAPSLRCVVSDSHPDYDFSAHETVRDAKHKYGNGKDVLWHVVGDTREGWAKALEIWENAAFEKIHKDKLLILDFSEIRAKGSPIKGMQNRPASGPVPLMNAFLKSATMKGTGVPKWIQTIYIDHYFAECVLVGGARRAARMSTKTWRDKTVLDFITIKRPIEFTSKDVEEIQEIRKVSAPQGFLWSSNNSITVDQEFWNLLSVKKGTPEYNNDLTKHARNVYKLAVSASYGDGTGEPGFINVDKINQSKENLDKMLDINKPLIGSKKYTINEDTNFYVNKLFKKAIKKPHFMITNPCVSGDTWIQTEEGPRQVFDLLDKSFKAVVDGKPYQATGFFKTGDKTVYKLTTNRGQSIKLTENHKLLVEKSKNRTSTRKLDVVKEWTELKDIKLGDKIVLSNQRGLEWNGKGIFEEGWLIGEIIGDGGHNPEKYDSYLRFWGSSSEHMSDYAVACLDKSNIKYRSDFTGKISNKANKTIETSCVGLTALAEEIIHPLSKEMPSDLETYSSEFCRGLLRGIFDADGTVSTNRNKGISVRLGQISVSKLETFQRILSRLGIISTIYLNRKNECLKMMPDGKGGHKNYKCQPFHELVISKDNFVLFDEIIGFSEPEKDKKLKAMISDFKRMPYRETFTAKVSSIEEIGIEPVYDCMVDEVHAFDANGIMAHNCGEISLALWGAFCTIADLVPFHSETIEEVIDCAKSVTRALIRVNTMDSVYSEEVKRTNRIGIGMTGVHEFAWKFFGFGFKDLINEEKSKEFWMTLSKIKKAIQDEAVEYSLKLGINPPHSDTTIKPAGCNSLDNQIKTNLGVLSFNQLFADVFDIDVENMIEDSWYEVDQKISVQDQNDDERFITRLYCNGFKELFEIDFEDGKKYKFTGNHKLLTSNRGWVRVDELVISDDIVSF